MPRHVPPIRSIVGGTAVAVMLLGLALASPVVASDPPAELTFIAERRAEGGWMLRATLTQGGAVQSQQTVEFLQAVDFFGPRWIPLGNATTDTSGVASRLYSPTSNGVQRLVARHAALQSAPVEITVVGAVPAIPREPADLPIVRAWALPIGAAVLVGVWLMLAAILLSAVIGISRSARRKARDNRLGDTIGQSISEQA